MNLLRSISRIMYYDYTNGFGMFLIVKKSIYRWYRFGWYVMCEWIDKELWRLPNEVTELHIDSLQYQHWIRKSEPLLGPDKCDVSVRFSLFVIAESETKMKDTIRSIENQSYQNYEIIILGETKNTTHLVVQNWHDAYSNSTGQWGIILRNGAHLSSSALMQIGFEIEKNPNACIIYTDDDLIDVHGNRYDPYFKCDFNRDLYYGLNYIGDSFSWSMEQGPPMSECDGYGLILQKIDTSGAKAIRHIPQVLFHYEKRYEGCIENETESLIQYFDQSELDVCIQKQSNGIRRLIWGIEESVIKVSIIIPSRNQAFLLRRNIESILSITVYSNYEIIVIDNQSDEPSALEYFTILEKEPKIRVLRYPHPFNYSAINNFAVNSARGEVLVFLNDDTEVIHADWLYEMVSNAMREEIGCVGALLYYPDDTIQHAGVVLGIGGIAGHIHKYMQKGSSGYFYRLQSAQNLSAVTGACVAVQKKRFEEVGGFEEQLAVAYNDIDFSLKLLERGYYNIWTPFAQLIHHESKSRGKNDTVAKKERYEQEKSYMYKRWGTYLDNDIYYSPYLSRVAEQFQLRTGRTVLEGIN